MTPRLRLFCLPYAGGSALRIYGTWDRYLPADIDVVPVELAGRGSRIGEVPVPRAEALVADALRQVLPGTDAPFALFGHSLGAMLAFEVARALEHLNNRTPAHLLVSGFQAPDLPHQPDRDYLLPDPQFRDRLRALAGTPPEVLDNDELMDLLLPVLRADFAALDQWRYRPGPPLSCPVTVFGALSDPEVPVETLGAWRRQTTGGFQVRLLPGHHFFIHEAAELLLPLIADRLQGTRPQDTRPVAAPVRSQ